ncbi:MAG: 7-cyano-7-deazaguanine synthase QueC [Longimonas sp.]|uniref:7-cyano-7-deazaguanine synthase QueC n=1 Tax=Longimonas sp. TaxID=2039626 RepID=UPI0039761DB5
MPTDSAALVLFSGGQDSTTCLFWALQRFAQVQTLGFSYGQKHAVEIEQAEQIAEKAGVAYDCIDLTGALSGSALTEHDKDMNAPHAQNEDLPASFVPGRNALFLSTAASYAYNRGITQLVGGMCQTDYSGYPDCRRTFISAMQTSLSLAMDADLQIHTPLMDRTKAETWKLAADLGTVAGCDVLETVRVMSHTDYNGDRSHLNEWGYGQLDNPASKLRAQGYEEAKEKGWV